MATQKLPSDTLAKPTRRAPWILGAGAAVAICAAAIAFGPAVASQLNPTPSPTTSTTSTTPSVPVLTPAELDSVQQAADAQQSTISADKAAAAAAAAAEEQAALAAAHQQQTTDGPVKCETGYTANAVDAVGNESNCQKNGPGNQPCVAYNDQNQCTAYYKP